MQVALHKTERIDDLLTHDLKIIQSEEVFAFSLDAVLLARFCTVPPRGKIVDLCSGNGVIPLLLSTRTPAAEIWGVEIQERLAGMGKRNIELNGLQDRLHMVHADLKQIHWTLGASGYDLVTVNPPYLPVPAGEQNRNEHVAAARHELFCTLEDVVASSAKLLKAGGKMAMVHRPNRLVDICTLMRQYRVEPKRVRFVHPRQGEEAMMVLIEGIRDGKADMRTLPPLFVHEEGGRYCGELHAVFYGEKSELEAGGQKSPENERNRG
ncbi:tRNA1(Val) (adenine(37)-N6)-methyltransferase [Paenibacillus chitinolyticus]|uniref:tRNA1(Val) (adenine(37)-N6)-methyltransferase n=1 Tax=Paenibacillus chitinolyticus TaxID=79263 RepID=UPI0035E148CC